MPDEIWRASRYRQGGGKRKNRDNRRTKRREEALARQAIYDTLTIDEKLAKTKRGSRQYLKLIKQKER